MAGSGFLTVLEKSIRLMCCSCWLRMDAVSAGSSSQIRTYRLLCCSCIMSCVLCCALLWQVLQVMHGRKSSSPCGIQLETPHRCMYDAHRTALHHPIPLHHDTQHAMRNTMFMVSHSITRNAQPCAICNIQLVTQNVQQATCNM